MIECNCTLIETEVCKICKLFYSRMLEITPTLSYTNYYKMYNPETHELVEKKEAKINNIGREIDNLTSSIYIIRSNNDEYQKLINDGNKSIEGYKDKISKLKQELEQLRKTD